MSVPKEADLEVSTIKSYTGIEAELYDLLRGNATSSEIEFYNNLLSEQGGIALELGCGTGRLLLPLLKTGLQVEGADNSQDMLQICQQAANIQNLNPSLHQCTMEGFKLPQRYDTIFIEGGTFMLLTNRQTAMKALNNIHTHLKPKGQVLIELFLPLDDLKRSDSTWKIHKTAIRPTDNAKIFCSTFLSCDALEQLRQGWTKYDVYNKGRLTISQIVESKLRWYSKYEFIFMLENSGFSDIHLLDTQVKDGADSEIILFFKATK